jgi:hypothetical protein
MKTTCLTVELTALEPARLPRYKGAVVRGGFGLAFRRVSCPFPKRECADCLLNRQCVWSYVFNTPRPEDATVMRKYETIPHPFVIEPPDDDRTRLAPGDRLEFGLVLVGRAIEHVPYFIYAFEQMAEQGLGPGRGRFTVSAVRQQGTVFFDGKAKTIIAPLKTSSLELTPGQPGTTQVAIRFVTPLRIIYQGKMSRRPQFHVLVRALLRRLGLLAYFHDQPVELDYRGLIAQAEAVKMVDCTLAGCEWRRYSTRQDRVIEMEGMTGTATYEGNIGPFLPFLRAGEILHIGKGTTFGMGKYQMEVR